MSQRGKQNAEKVARGAKPSGRRSYAKASDSFSSSESSSDSENKTRVYDEESGSYSSSESSSDLEMQPMVNPRSRQSARDVRKRRSVSTFNETGRVQRTGALHSQLDAIDLYADPSKTSGIVSSDEFELLWNSQVRDRAIELAETLKDPELKRLANSITVFGIDVTEVPTAKAYTSSYVFTVNQVQAKIARRSLMQRLSEAQTECDRLVEAARKRARELDSQFERQFETLGRQRTSLVVQLTRAQDRLNRQRNFETAVGGMMSSRQLEIDQLAKQRNNTMRSLYAKNREIGQLIADRRANVAALMAEEAKIRAACKEEADEELALQEKVDEERIDLLQAETVAFQKIILKEDSKKPQKDDNSE